MLKSAILLALAAALPLPAADVCQNLTAVTGKIWEVPVHLYVTLIQPGLKTQPKPDEQIYTASGAIYIMIGGKWSRSPLTISQMKAARDSARADSAKAPQPTCRYLRDEAVNGEPAAVYATHVDTEDAKIETTLWISKAKNLPLRSETDTNIGGGASGKSHSEVRYDYSNVQLPPGVK